MIEVLNLTKRYRQRTVVDGVTFTVRPGKVTGFLGRNGAGKPVPGLRHNLRGLPRSPCQPPYAPAWGRPTCIVGTASWSWLGGEHRTTRPPGLVTLTKGDRVSATPGMPRTRAMKS